MDARGAGSELAAAATGKNPCSDLATATPTIVEHIVARTEGRKIPPGSSDPSAERIAITPSGSTAPPDVLIARKSTIELVATPGWEFRLFSSFMALRPKGVAALPRPRILAEMFMIIALIAGCSAGISGKSRRISGASARAIERISPASCSTRIRPSQSAIMPSRPIAVWMANFADSIMPSLVTASMLPAKAAYRTALRTSAMKMLFMLPPPRI